MISELSAAGRLPGYICPQDGRRADAEDLYWRCPACGSPWDLDFTAAAVNRAALDGRPSSLWRYTEALPINDPALSLGEGRTPLVDLTDHVAAKMDYLMPTLSFKDRGAAMLIELARRLGPEWVIADSSGNAGTAVAAYAARAGLACRIFVPAATSSKKVEQIRGHGAEIELVPGDRAAAAHAAQRAAKEPGTFYASHVFNPYFLHGTKTYGYELWEDHDGRLPKVLVVPVGNGTLLLGVALAIEELHRNGVIGARPRIVGVQSAAVAPLAAAHRAGHRGLLPAEQPTPGSGGETIAEGIAIAAPARAAQILAVLDRLDGDLVTVDDDQVRAAQADLARRGLYVESTAAVCWAAVCAAEAAGDEQRAAQPGWALLRQMETVVSLCGAGLKTGLV